MEFRNLNAILQHCLRVMKWRLRRTSVERLIVDIAALCTGLRVAVMVDYARGTRCLQDHLLELLDLLAQELRSGLPLRVMSINDTLYLIHEENLCVYMEETLNGAVQIRFVVLDDAVARFAFASEEDAALRQFMLFQGCLLCLKSFSKKPVINIGNLMDTFEIILPTLNGWLLGYPVVYLFKKENVSRALRLLSTEFLHRYELQVQSDILPLVQGGLGAHEISSFTIPNGLSSQGLNEEWAQLFLSTMRRKAEESQIWKSLNLQVSLQVCHSVVL